MRISDWSSDVCSSDLVRMVLLPSQFLTRKLLDDCFEAAGAEPLVVAQLNSIAPLIGLIRQTGLAGLIAATAVTPSADLRVVPLEDPTPLRPRSEQRPAGTDRASPFRSRGSPLL